MTNDSMTVPACLWRRLDVRIRWRVKWHKKWSGKSCGQSKDTSSADELTTHLIFLSFGQGFKWCTEWFMKGLHVSAANDTCPYSFTLIPRQTWWTKCLRFHDWINQLTLKGQHNFLLFYLWEQPVSSLMAKRYVWVCIINLISIVEFYILNLNFFCKSTKCPCNSSRIMYQ